MDTRESLKNKNNPNQEAQYETELDDAALNDSLIYNILKKIEIRQKMTNQYIKEKQNSNDIFLTKYVFHSLNPVYYMLAILGIKCYKYFNATNTKIFGLANTLFHLCVALSINQYSKYQKIFKLNTQAGYQYQTYRLNVNRLMEIKSQRISFYKKITNSQFFQPDKVLNALKYRLIL